MHLFPSALWCDMSVVSFNSGSGWWRYWTDEPFDFSPESIRVVDCINGLYSCPMLGGFVDLPAISRAYSYLWTLGLTLWLNSDNGR